jgi:LEA14-like dessication related protein
MRLSVCVLLLALAASTSACVSRPTLELYGARVQSASPMGIGMTMLMRVNNDNAFDVKVRNVRVNVVIAYRFYLPPVQYNPDVWLPAHKSTVVPVPMTVPWNMVTPLLATTAGSSELTYRASGFVDVTAVRLLGIRRNDEKIDEQGSVSRGELLAAAGRGFFTPVPAY